MSALQTKEQFLAAQVELEGLELAIAKGEEDEDTDARIRIIETAMAESPWSLHPDHGCILKEVDTYHYHEVADRCHVILCNLDEHLIKHAAVALNAEATLKLQQASALIAEVYQWAGSASSGVQDSQETPVAQPSEVQHRGLWRNNPDTPGGKYLVKRRDGTVVGCPFFVISARDPAAPDALNAYADSSEWFDCDPVYIADVRKLAIEFKAYLAEHGRGDPYASPHLIDDPETVAQMRDSKGA